LYVAKMQVQLSSGRSVDLAGHAHCETDKEPGGENREFGHWIWVELEGQNDPDGHIPCTSDPEGQYAPEIEHTNGVAEARGQYAPAGHVRQLAVSPKALYFPAGQGEHAVPLGPVKPGLHVQFLMKFDMAGDEVLGGH
jgi:hypothetical protein